MGESSTRVRARDLLRKNMAVSMLFICLLGLCSIYSMRTHLFKTTMIHVRSKSYSESRAGDLNVDVEVAGNVRGIDLTFGDSGFKRGQHRSQEQEEEEEEGVDAIENFEDFAGHDFDDVAFDGQQLSNEEILGKAKNRKQAEKWLNEFNITFETPFYSFEQLKKYQGGQCPPLRHCKLKTSINFFLRGGNWKSSRKSPTGVVFHPFDCWTYTFSGQEDWAEFSQHRIVLLDGGDSPLLQQIAQSSDVIQYLKATMPVEDDQVSNLVDKIKTTLGGGIASSTVTLASNWVSKGYESQITEAMSSVKESLGANRVNLLWLSQPYEDNSQAEFAIEVNEGMNTELQKHKFISGVDTFSPSINAPAETINPGKSEIVAQHVANYILNHVFADVIMEKSQFRKSKSHVCQKPSDCTSCFLVHAEIPSTRLSHFIVQKHLAKRNVPTIITLAEKDRIWQDGSWIEFNEINGDKKLSVRRDYSKVATRRFEPQKMTDYLVSVNIIKPSSSKGGFEEVHLSNEESKELPKYAGNNKLSQEMMDSFHFKYPPWFVPSELQRPSMWLGPKNSMSGLHVDHTNDGNLAYQILGQKKWMLLPPRCESYLYLKKIGVVLWSAIADPREYDRQLNRKFPLFRLAVSQTLELSVKQGQLLYNPNAWFHVVYNTESSLMLNFWLKKH